MSLKALGFVLAVALGAALAPGVIAKEGDESPQTQISPEAKHLAESLIDDALQASRIPEIYADLRATLRDVYLPMLRDAVQGDLPGAPAPDSKTAAMIAKAYTFLNYVRRAGDELDGALTENRQTMISDAATIIARSAGAAEINDVRALVRLPAVRKGFDAFYALTRLVTGLTYQDSRSLSEFSAWVQGLNLDVSQTFQNGPGSPGTLPSQHKVAKAQVLFNDLFKISHLDDIVADIKRFVRDVYAETAPLSETERRDLKDQIDQLEFAYNLQKSITLAAAPSLIAAALTDEQLATADAFVHSAACAKVFNLVYDFVKAATAFTKEDITAAQGALEDLDRKSKLREKSEEDREKISEDWKAFWDKWSERLKNRLSPETRSGLEKSFEALETLDEPI